MLSARYFVPAGKREPTRVALRTYARAVSHRADLQCDRQTETVTRSEAAWASQSRHSYPIVLCAGHSLGCIVDLALVVCCHTLLIITVILALSSPVCSPVQFCSVQDGIYALGKVRMRSVTPFVRSFPSVAFETGSNVDLTDDGPLSSLQGRPIVWWCSWLCARR